MVPDQLRLALELPVTAASVPAGRQAAARFAQQAALPEETVAAVRLAVSEALTNVVLHAHVDDAPGTPRQFELRGEVARGHVCFVVVDHGTGLRPRADSPGLGLGLSVMTRVADEHEVASGEDGGTRVRLLFRRRDG